MGIKSIFKKIKGKKATKISIGANGVSPNIIPRQDHPLSRSYISPNAVKVLYRLNAQGYGAFLVGGGVRDLLLGREPKDFDIVTDAKPEEIKKIFKNSLLIGKRFKLVHVRFKHEIIEVSTFRTASFNPEPSHQYSAKGIIERDNIYGTIDDDVWRRDFTVNALYYNIADFSLIDYVGGLEDLKKNTLRMIGKPEVRYQEDPVRMLRAIRIASKLGFTIEDQTAKSLTEMGELLQHVSSFRLFDEILKLFLSGCSVAAFAKLKHYNLFGYLFPDVNEALTTLSNNHEIDFFLMQLFSHTDKRVIDGKIVSPAYLFAAILWFPFLQKMQEYKNQDMRELVAFDLAAKDIIHLQNQIIAIPKRFIAGMREIWLMQFRFNRRAGRRPFRLVFEQRFRAGYDFLLLRSEANPELIELAQWWTAFYEADEPGRKELLDDLRKPSCKKRSQDA